VFGQRISMLPPDGEIAQPKHPVKPRMREAQTVVDPFPTCELCDDVDPMPNYENVLTA
jgi:hypothetical protein